MRSFLVSVYRTDYDATNNGVTSPSRAFRWYKLYTSEPNEAEIEAAVTSNTGVLVLDRREGKNWGPIARPADTLGEKRRLGTSVVGGMFGGNFVWSSDSRFRDQVSETPIPVHDRFDRYDDYLALST